MNREWNPLLQNLTEFGRTAQCNALLLADTLTVGLRVSPQSLQMNVLKLVTSAS